MSDSLKKKLDIVFRALQNEHEYCSFEELNERVVFEEGLSKEERFKSVVDTVCKYTIDTKDKNWIAKLYGGKGSFTYYVINILAIFKFLLPPPPSVINRNQGPLRICSRIRSRGMLHFTLHNTLPAPKINNYKTYKIRITYYTCCVILIQ